MILFYLSGIIMLFISFIFFLLFSMFLYMKFKLFMEWNVLDLNSCNIIMLFYIDWISLLFISTVMLISSMIMIYCCEYMNHDNYNIRFFYLILLFIISMIFMIISPNLISILIGWDGLGLISYCLVIYYQNYSSYNSGMLTVLLNRIGDVMILISISLMFMMGSWNFLNFNITNTIILCLVIIAAFTKSAQFPFSSWLPAAMAAPTPVSSLVHSSTLVTAGVYLLVRFNHLIYNNLNLLTYIQITGLLTMMFAGLSANFEFDIKKIIAYSTLSQLGLMMMIFGFKNWELTYFHLIIHAMFKSMMFMCSGVLIHSMLNYQDIRFMGKAYKYVPMTMSLLMISNLSLCGMPFMSGFYSKDQILDKMFMNKSNFLMYVLLLISTGLTVSYSVRMIYYLMNYSMNFLSMNLINDFKLMNMPMIILMIMSIIFGNIMNWMVFMNIENIFLLFWEKVMILLTCVVSIYLGKLIYQITKINKLYFLKFFLGKLWFMYNFIPLVIKYPLIFSKKYSSYYDKGWSEMFMKNSMMNFMMHMNEDNKLMYKNNIMLMLLSSSFIMMFMMF
nr:NADH dehydrogenase subunit 5 [Micranisa ralianga]